MNAKIVAGTADVDKEAVVFSQEQDGEKVRYGDDASDDGECLEVDDLCAVYDVEWNTDAVEIANTNTSNENTSEDEVSPANFHKKRTEISEMIEPQVASVLTSTTVVLMPNHTETLNVHASFYL